MGVSRNVPMDCSLCQAFLLDSLDTGISADSPFASKIHRKAFTTCIPEFASWLLLIHSRISKEEFNDALSIASRIARRNRSVSEYEILIHTATYNLLCFERDWLRKETSYIQLVLLEAGCFRGKQSVHVESVAMDYLRYKVPRVLLCLQELHTEHAFPLRDTYPKEILVDMD